MTLNTVLLCSVLLHVGHVSALFEDQAGKFDWKQKYVGEVSHMGYYSNSQTSVLVVATKSHVVAGLDADNGVISVIGASVSDHGRPYPVRVRLEHLGRRRAKRAEGCLWDSD